MIFKIINNSNKLMILKMKNLGQKNLKITLIQIKYNKIKCLNKAKLKL